MDVNVINQFIIAIKDVFKQVGNIELKKANLEYFPKGNTVNAGIAAILGITGDLKGQFIMAISEDIAKKIASAILMGMEVKEYDEVAESAVCEMGNMVGGASSRMLHEIGHTCDITVPSIVRGKEVVISFYPASPLFVVHFVSDWGPLQLMLRLEN